MRTDERQKQSLCSRTRRLETVRRPTFTWTLTRPEQALWAPNARRADRRRATEPETEQRTLREPRRHDARARVLEGERGATAVVVVVVVPVVVVAALVVVADVLVPEPDPLEPAPVDPVEPVELVVVVLLPSEPVVVVDELEDVDEEELDDELELELDEEDEEAADVVVPPVEPPVLDVPPLGSGAGASRPTTPVGLQSESVPPFFSSKSTTAHSSAPPPTAPSSCAPVNWRTTSVPSTEAVEPPTGDMTLPFTSNRANSLMSG
jgi:hypothetical protein